MSAICPKCERSISYTQPYPFPSTEINNREWETVALTCPICHSILNIQIDPSAIIAAAAAMIAKTRT